MAARARSKLKRARLLSLLGVLLGCASMAYASTPHDGGWQSLSAQQKMTLAPLQKDWPSMEESRRQKWLGVADRYPKLTLEEQLRIQSRMREWASLTPEQRKNARQRYNDLRKNNPQQREVVRERWASFQTLTAEDKQKIAARKTDSRIANRSSATTITKGSALPSKPIERKLVYKPVTQPPTSKSIRLSGTPAATPASGFKASSEIDTNAASNTATR